MDLIRLRLYLMARDKKKPHDLEECLRRGLGKVSCRVDQRLMEADRNCLFSSVGFKAINGKCVVGKENR